MHWIEHRRTVLTEANQRTGPLSSRTQDEIGGENEHHHSENNATGQSMFFDFDALPIDAEPARTVVYHIGRFRPEQRNDQGTGDHGECSVPARSYPIEFDDRDLFDVEIEDKEEHADQSNGENQRRKTAER